MAELADALDLGSSGNPRAGSSPVTRTMIGDKKDVTQFFSVFMRVCGLFGAKSEKRFYRRCPNSKPQQNPSKRGFRLKIQAGGPAFLRFTPFFPLPEV